MNKNGLRAASLISLGLMALMLLIDHIPLYVIKFTYCIVFLTCSRVILLHTEEVNDLLLSLRLWKDAHAEIQRRNAFIMSSFNPIKKMWPPAEIRAAMAVLGIKDFPRRGDVIRAHRELIADAHPDHGGCGDHASRINDARDVLFRFLDTFEQGEVAHG